MQHNQPGANNNASIMPRFTGRCKIENYLKHNQLVIHFPVLPIYYGRIQSQGSPILNLVALQNMNFSPLVKIFKIKECLLSHQTTAK